MKKGQSIEVKRLNFFISKNRLMGNLFLDKKYKIKDFSFPL